MARVAPDPARRRASQGGAARSSADTIPLAAHQRAADYTVERTRLGMLEIVRAPRC
jgi:STE24 endopeptidase